ncbi:hypothetical protein [Paraburkholderia sp.]|uniref:hypothetical protein n=1 Tax=Paraburkholderia sp. TaxID=1926495 RepID=UPI003D6ED84D
MPSIRPVCKLNRVVSRTALAFTVFCFAAGDAAAQSSVKPVVTPGFSLSVFATGSGGLFSAPDSLAVLDDHVWVGYANTGAPDGSNGAKSEIVEYSLNGTVVKTYEVAGHNDGLKVNPYTREIWAMQNEDASPNLVIITPATGQASAPYSFDKTLHGGGYDDLVFKDGVTYLSASNPTLSASGKNTGPAIVRIVRINANTHTIGVAPTVSGTLSASDIPFGTVTTLNLTDPDSMTLTPSGDVLLDDQGDGQLVLFHSSGNEPRVQYLPLLGQVQVDDTVFATARRGFLLVSDTKANTVYKVSANVWQRDAAFSASGGVATATPPVPGYMGQLDMRSGALLPLVTNLGSPHGMAFVAQGDNQQ